MRREQELVTYELNHAHFVQDIFEVVTICLKIQLQIGISDASNFPQKKCMERLYFRDFLVVDLPQAHIQAIQMM